jgi:hypothetical protein
MGFFDHHRSDPPGELSPEQVAYLRRVLDVHASHPSTGHCQVCGLRCCTDWRDAFDRLAVAGQPTADPDRWRPSDRDLPT